MMELEVVENSHAILEFLKVTKMSQDCMQLLTTQLVKIFKFK